MDRNGKGTLLVAAVALATGALLAPTGAGATPAGSPQSVDGGTSGGSTGAVLVTDVVGGTTEDLRAAHDAGQSLTEYAASRGRSREELVSRLAEYGLAQIDEDVAAGRITRAEGDARKAQLVESVGELADQVPGQHVTVAEQPQDGTSGEIRMASEPSDG